MQGLRDCPKEARAQLEAPSQSVQLNMRFDADILNFLHGMKMKA